MYTTTVQKFIVIVMPGTHVTTTVQKLIVVVMPATHVPTTNREEEEDQEEGAKMSFKIAQNLI